MADLVEKDARSWRARLVRLSVAVALVFGGAALLALLVLGTPSVRSDADKLARAKVSPGIAEQPGIAEGLSGAEQGAEHADAPSSLPADALVAARALVEAEPANLSAKEALAHLLIERAGALPAGGNYAEAKDAWIEIAALRRAVWSGARTPETAAGLAYALEQIGDAAAQLRDATAVLAAYSEAAALRREALATAPSDLRARGALGSVLHALALTKKLSGDEQGARVDLAQAASLRVALAGEAKGDEVIAYQAAESLQQLALLQARSDGTAAKRSFAHAKVLLEPLVRAHADNAHYAASLAKTNEALAALEEAP